MISQHKHWCDSWPIYLLAVLASLFFAFPIFWALSTSLKSESDIMNSALTFLPNPITSQNYIKVWTVGKFSQYFSNSLLTAGIALILVIFLSICNGYALSRFRFKGSKVFMMSMLGAQMLPILMLLIPLFIIYKNMSLINSPGSLIITYTIIQIPFNTLLMRGFIGSIPPQVDEAAMIDGATRLEVILFVIVPVIVPGLIATGAFAFIGSWNDFFVAYAFVTKQANFTISVGLKFLISEYSVEYGAIAAGSIIALIPPLLMFSYVQRYLIQGLGSGAIKG